MGPKGKPIWSQRRDLSASLVTTAWRSLTPTEEKEAAKEKEKPFTTFVTHREKGRVRVFRIPEFHGFGGKGREALPLWREPGGSPHLSTLLHHTA